MSEKILRAFHLVFQQAEQSGAYKSKDKVHYHSDGKGFEISVISSSYAFCCVEKFYNSNNGMTHVQTMMNVILPQALRNIMPQIGNNLIINIKDTCVLSIIGIVELFYTTKGVAGAYYTYFESFTIAMVMYFILTFAASV